MSPLQSRHTSRPARVRRVVIGKEPATSSQRGARVRIQPNVTTPRIETRRISDAMTAQTFFQKSNAAMVDTFSLIGVNFSGSGVLNRSAFNMTDLPCLVKQLKTFVSGFIALALHDELPSGFSPSLAWNQLTPPAKRYIRTRILSKRNLARKIGLAAMINYSKRLFPQLPQAMVGTKLSDFETFVSTPDVGILHERNAIEEALYQEVNRLPRFRADWTKPFTPSSSACFEVGRANGGIAGVFRGVLREWIQDNPWLEKISKLELIREDVMFSDLGPVWDGFLEVMMDRFVEDYPLYGPWLPSLVAPVGLGEPLKVRVITKSSFLNQLLKPIQVAWHSTMRQDPIYELIGGVPVTQSIADLRLSPGQSFVSGDYEAATDRIHLHYTDYVSRLMVEHTDFIFPDRLVRKYGQSYLEGLFSRFVPYSFNSIYLVLLRAGQMSQPGSLGVATFLEANARGRLNDSPFGGARFPADGDSTFVTELDRKDERGVDHKIETIGDSLEWSAIPVCRGQMMGHILSFPLLCLINKAVSCMALPPDRFIRVNGDDVLFAASPREYREWEIHTKNVGLKKSVGKNYYSRDMAMINSEVYLWSKSTNRLERISVPNVGLLGYAQEFYDDKGKQILPIEQLSGILTEFWKGVPEGSQRAALALVRHRYERLLSSFPGSLFGPKSLGNMGLPIGPCFKGYTRYQLRHMEAHRKGLFSIWEGTRSDYSAIETLFQKEIELQDKFLTWGVPDRVLVPERILKDPYSRGGGYSLPLMQMRQWIVSPTSEKHSIIFGRRRFNRFLQKNPSLNILGGSALESILTNTWSEERRQWFHRRRGTIYDYEEEISPPYQLQFA